MRWCLRLGGKGGGRIICFDGVDYLGKWRILFLVLFMIYCWNVGAVDVGRVRAVHGIK